MLTYTFIISLIAVSLLVLIAGKANHAWASIKV